MTEGLGNTEISRVAFKAPIFWDSDPELWFQQVESQFFIAGIKEDSTKFHSIVASLDVKILNCCRDLIRSPPKENAYSALKTRVLEYFAQSENSRLKLLLHDLTLGDKKPSQLLNDMQSLANNSMSDEVLRTLWLQRLPNQMQLILSACKDSLKDLAIIADKINEVSGCVSVAASLTDSADLSIKSLHSEISSLKLEVQRLARSRDRQNSRNRRRSRSQNRRSFSKNLQQGKLCWYHKRFADKASKCISPCQWSEN